MSILKIIKFSSSHLNRREGTGGGGTIAPGGGGVREGDMPRGAGRALMKSGGIGNNTTSQVSQVKQINFKQINFKIILMYLLNTVASFIFVYPLNSCLA